MLMEVHLLCFLTLHNSPPSESPSYPSYNIFADSRISELMHWSILGPFLAIWINYFYCITFTYSLCYPFKKCNNISQARLSLLKSELIIRFFLWFVVIYFLLQLVTHISYCDWRLLEVNAFEAAAFVFMLPIL